MQYQQGKIGRVFLAKIEDGDDLLEELKNLAQKEEINSANFFLTGRNLSCIFMVFLAKETRL